LNYAPGVAKLNIKYSNRLVHCACLSEEMIHYFLVLSYSCILLPWTVLWHNHIVTSNI